MLQVRPQEQSELGTRFHMTLSTPMDVQYPSLVGRGAVAPYLFRVDCDEVVEDDRQHCQDAQPVREVVKSVVADHFVQD